MKKRKSTRCFTYEDDTWEEVGMAHAEPTVARIADLVLKYPSLLRDLSRLLLKNITPVPLQSKFMTKTYRLIKGRELNKEEAILGDLLDKLYSTKYQNTLETRRGVILERIIQKAVEFRVVDGVRGEVVINAMKVAPAATDEVINDYSVDVAACFYKQRQTEFYACKLNVLRIEPDKLPKLDEIGEVFTYYCQNVETAVCCLQQKSDLRSIKLKINQLMGPYPDISLLTVEDIQGLMS